MNLTEMIQRTVNGHGRYEIDAEMAHNLYLGWKEGKAHLIKLFGEELIIKKDVEVGISRREAEAELRSICTKINSYLESLDILGNTDDGEYSTWFNFVTASELYSNLSEYKQGYKKGEKTVIINKGTKIFKSLRKAGELVEDREEYDKKMEEYRIEASMILGRKTKKKTICLSIHPLDYLTMSDNNHGWCSCLSLKDRGCYSSGVFEALRDKHTIVAYIEGTTPMKITSDLTWNSKSWRVLIHHKESHGEQFFLKNKEYPYSSETSEQGAMEIVKEVFKLPKLYDITMQDILSIETNYLYNDPNNDFDATKGYSTQDIKFAWYKVPMSLATQQTGVCPCGRCGMLGDEDYVCGHCLDELGY